MEKDEQLRLECMRIAGRTHSIVGKSLLKEAEGIYDWVKNGRTLTAPPNVEGDKISSIKKRK